jgi:hypothetical protein
VPGGFVLFSLLYLGVSHPRPGSRPVAIANSAPPRARIKDGQRAGWFHSIFSPYFWVYSTRGRDPHRQLLPTPPLRGPGSRTIFHAQLHNVQVTPGIPSSRRRVFLSRDFAAGYFGPLIWYGRFRPVEQDIVHADCTFVRYSRSTRLENECLGISGPEFSSDGSSSGM